MNWDMVTSLAAIICQIAIVVCLIYIARQMKEAARQRKVESYHSVIGEMDAFGKLLAEDHANADIWWRASKGIEHLTDAERVRYFALLSTLFRSWEKAFHYHSEGGLAAWRADVIAKNVADLTMSRGVQEYWALRKRWYAQEFQEWVDSTIKERGGVDVYGDQFRMFGSADKRDAAPQ
jgi:hypothetical protein